MSHTIAVRCPQCGFTWNEDLDWHVEHETLHVTQTDAGRESFRFKCPQDGTWVTVEVESGEG